LGFAEDAGKALGAFLPDWAVVLLICLLPFIELRGALPVAVLLYHWDLTRALLFCMFFSAIPGLVIVFYMDRAEPWLRKVRLFDRILTRVFERTRRKHAEPDAQQRRDRRALLLLALLVAIPGPGTGAWTGGLVSYVFEVPKRKAVAAIAMGVLGEGLAMAALVLLFQFSVGGLP
jgi:uncharacterized membrane protein